MTVGEFVSAASVVGTAIAKGHLDRQPYLVESNGQPITPSVLHLDSIREAAIRATNKGHRQRRREIAGEPIWGNPIRYVSLLKNDLTKGPAFERAQRVAGGVRHSIFENTEYGKLYEAAMQSDTPHDWDHSRRLFDLAEAVLTQPEVKLSNQALIMIPSLWINTHDAAQSIREYQGIREAKEGHDYLALLQALTQKKLIMNEAGISEDTARLITGANAVLMLYHDEPKIHQRILDAIEREDSLLPYTEFPDRNGNIVRKYITPSELMGILDNPNSEKVDLTAVPDWLMAQAVKLRLNKKGFGTEKDPLSFGFDSAFERDFHDELEQIAKVPEGEGVTDDGEGHTLLYTPEQRAAADERALIPRRLLDQQTRIDIAHLGDIMRTVDFFDMTPPGLGLVRKLEVPMNWNRPIFRPDAYESITSGPSKLPPEEDSMHRRGLYELFAGVMQIQKQPGQLRPALDGIRYVRDNAYRLFELGIEAHIQTMPILMSGDITEIRAELTRILGKEHERIARKINTSRSLNPLQKTSRINEHLKSIKGQVDRIMENMRGQFNRTYEVSEVEDAIDTALKLQKLADMEYRSLYKGRRTRPGRPYKTWESTTGANLSRLRAIRKHSGHDQETRASVAA